MQINNIGYNHCHNADFIIQRPHGSGDCLFLLLKTPAVFVFNGSEDIAKENSFILYDKSTPQFYRAYGTQFINDWFHFSISEDEYGFIRQLEIPFDKVVHTGNINDLSNIIKNMCYENFSSNKHKDEAIGLYFRLLFIKLSDKINSEENSGSGSYYDKMSILRSKIYSMPYHKWSVEKLANSLSVSVSYFEHTYKKIFGVSVINDVIQSRIEHSKYLLSTTDISVIKIAEMCGYSSSSHFMKQFRSRMDMTPKEYRRLMCKNIIK